MFWTKMNGELADQISQFGRRESKKSHWAENCRSTWPTLDERFALHPGIPPKYRLGKPAQKTIRTISGFWDDFPSESCDFLEPLNSEGFLIDQYDVSIIIQYFTNQLDILWCWSIADQQLSMATVAVTARSLAARWFKDLSATSLAFLAIETNGQWLCGARVHPSGGAMSERWRMQFEGQSFGFGHCSSQVGFWATFKERTKACVVQPGWNRDGAGPIIAGTRHSGGHHAVLHFPSDRSMCCLALHERIPSLWLWTPIHGRSDADSRCNIWMQSPPKPSMLGFC